MIGAAGPDQAHDTGDTDRPGPPISRREALGLLAAGTVTAGATLWWQLDGEPERLTPEAEAPLAQPAMLDSRAGRIHLELTAAAGARVAGKQSAAYGYNGQSPGPTIRVRPGDRISLRLTNRLDRTTNLHTHGLRVSPAGAGDNPFREVPAGGSFDYTIQLPQDHPPGTFWYHPHHHGTAADQIFGGLLGALLVVPAAGQNDVEVSADRVLMISDITLNRRGEIVAVSDSDRTIGREGELLLLNGQYRPTIRMQSGQWERWRLVNACTSRVLDLRLRHNDLLQIAVDGNTLPSPIAAATIRLSPGNRADVLVQGGEPGLDVLRAEPVDRGSFGRARPSTKTEVLATVVVSVPPGPRTPLPALPPAYQPSMAVVSRRRVLLLTMGQSMNDMGFGIDDRSYDPLRDDQRVDFGTTEEWMLQNVGPLAHPFHLHVWPFLVLETSDQQPAMGALQDVVLVPARGWARIRIPFVGHTGRSVYHCHIVDHSDHGMMGTINVSAAAPTRPDTPAAR